jgi:alpha-tubulin suppressor-like RCC1 family protein
MRPFLSAPLLTFVRPGRLAEGTAAALVVLSLAGCGNDPVSPSVPVSAAPQLAAAASTPLVFAQVSAGAYHTCGVTVDDLAYCWGEGALGDLGTGSTDGLSQFHPVPVAGGLRFQSVSAGTIYTCGITTDRLAYCWGLNSSGELGDGTTTTRFAPVPVAGSRKFRQLRAGFRHTCGVTTSNVALCWGYNADGELGDGTTTNRKRPVRVAGGLSFTQARAGGNHTCGWTTAGKAYCWGLNDEGQLGDGTLTGRLSPVAVAGSHTFAQVSPGGAHTCGATTDHKAYCWGQNEHFELGDGTQIRRVTPTAVIANGLSFDALAVGEFHSCALTTDDRAYCWGENAVGSLGDGSFGTRTTPWPVTGGWRYDVINVGAIGRHTCGVTGAGVALCWGWNSSGELGDGTQTNRPMPVKVLGP